MVSLNLYVGYRILPSQREKCPNTEFFLVRIFPHSDWIRRDTEYLRKIRTRKLWPTVSYRWFTFDRSSHQKCSMKKGVLRNCAKFTGKYLCQSLFLIKLLQPNLKRDWHRCFPVNFVKFLIKPFLQNTFGCLLLFRFL